MYNRFNCYKNVQYNQNGGLFYDEKYDEKLVYALKNAKCLKQNKIWNWKTKTCNEKPKLFGGAYDWNVLKNKLDREACNEQNNRWDPKKNICFMSDAKLAFLSKTYRDIVH